MASLESKVKFLKQHKYIDLRQVVEKSDKYFP